MSGDFIIEAGGRELARATKPSAFRDTIIVHYGRRDLTLRKPSVWRRAFALMDGVRDRSDSDSADLPCHPAFVSGLAPQSSAA
jgi:hypothetical protein